ncbi:hypothetical protein [Actinoplanes sp. NPDC051859]
MSQALLLRYGLDWREKHIAANRGVSQPRISTLLAEGSAASTTP